MNVEQRQRIERRVIRAFVKDAIAAGYSVAVHNGEDIEVPASTNVTAIMRGLMTTDDDRLLVYQDGKQIGWVRCIYGNDGWDVINDYTTNLERIMREAIAIADEIEERHG